MEKMWADASVRPSQTRFALAIFFRAFRPSQSGAWPVSQPLSPLRRRFILAVQNGWSHKIEGREAFRL